MIQKIKHVKICLPHKQKQTLQAVMLTGSTKNQVTQILIAKSVFNFFFIAEQKMRRCLINVIAFQTAPASYSAFLPFLRLKSGTF